MLTDNEKSKILFLWLDDKSFHAVNARRRGISVQKVYKDISLLLKIFRRLHIILGGWAIGLWLENWKNDVRFYETAIVHASKITSPVVRYMARNNPKLRIIVWYWNPVDKCEKLNKYPEELCERWTFDEADVLKYHLKYNSQYYFQDVSLTNASTMFDIFFVGGDKGRLTKLLFLQNKFNKIGLSTYFHITKTLNDNDPNNQNYDYKGKISYSIVLDYINKSKAILDFVSENQVGLTLRPLEALYFNKKLITNDKHIADRDFYRKENIFILDVDNIEEIEFFMSTPMVPVSRDIKLEYDFDKWIERFF